MSSKFNIPLLKAQQVAGKFLNLINPYCIKVSIGGALRRGMMIVNDIEFVAIPKDEFCLNKIFTEGYKGMEMNGSRLKRFRYPESQILITLHITTEKDYGRIVALYTGSSAYYRKLAIRLNRMGWIGTDDGLRLKRECDHKGSTWRIKPEYKNCPTLPPPFDTEEDFFAFIGVQWITPEKRSWVSNDSKHNYTL